MAVRICGLHLGEMVSEVPFLFGPLLQIVVFIVFISNHERSGRWWKPIFYEKLSCTKDEAFDLVQLTLEVLMVAIATEGKVKIGGFGSLMVRERAARRGRNPITGEPITITPRKVLTFEPSSVLKNRINQGWYGAKQIVILRNLRDLFINSSYGLVHA